MLFFCERLLKERMKRQITDWEKITANHLTKGLYLEYMKNSQNKAVRILKTPLAKIQGNWIIHTWLVDSEVRQLPRKTVQQFLKEEELNMQLSYSQATVILGIHPKEVKITTTEEPTHECS